MITLTTTSDRKRELASREHADNWNPCLIFSYQGPSMHDTTLQCCSLSMSVSIDDEPGENRILEKDECLDFQAPMKMMMMMIVVVYC